MDKTLELVIAATVILLTALTVIFMVGGQAGDFGNWAQGTQDDAACSLEKTRYENACDCDAQGADQDTSESRKIKSQSSCSWAESITSCQSVCDEGSSSGGSSGGPGDSPFGSGPGSDGGSDGSSGDSPTTNPFSGGAGGDSSSSSDDSEESDSSGGGGYGGSSG